MSNLRQLAFPILAIVAACGLAGISAANAGEPAPDKKLSVLFLGDRGHHSPQARFNTLNNAIAGNGINLKYSDNAADLNAETLAQFDALIIYANTEVMAPEQEKALLDYVAAGKGFIPLHCASACFKNSEKYIALVGAQFQSHGGNEFTTKTTAPEHPIINGFEPFISWDETYVHHKHNQDRTVLQTRREGDRDEPWSWVRAHGKGRIFYTASGHDYRTWDKPAFHELVERAIRWTCGDDKPSARVKAWAERAGLPRAKKGLKPFEYVDAVGVPFYSPGSNRGGADSGWNKMQLPLDAAESQKHLIVPEGFEAQLFAADPQIVKPICLAWDHKGRLWIAETVDYPNSKQPLNTGNDRITICEDTDNDGRADKFTLFADKLSIPTSLTFANGGVIVHQAPETLFLKDTNGDDKADERKVLFSGWGVGDTHAGPSNLKWGFDNWLWGIVGYSSFNGTVGGEKLQFSQGFYRFKPDGSKLEFLRSTNNNSWGVGFSEEGIIFGSTANANPSVYLSIPNRYYESVRGWSCRALENIADNIEIKPATNRVRQVDVHGRFTAATGHALYTARAYPKEYWNRVSFVNEPTGHVTATFKMERIGSHFIAKSSSNLVASDDEWTAPVIAEVGPDGNVWVIDWYNYIIQHNPTPHGFTNGPGNAYESPLRDKKHGRIYRIVYKEAKAAPAPKLDPNNPASLLAALRHDNLFWRNTAQRLLVERGNHGNTDVVPELIKLVQDQSVDELGLNVGAIHALWTLQGLGAIADNTPVASAVLAALKHPAAGVRRNAVQVIPRGHASLESLLDAKLLADADPQVRLAAALTLAEIPSSPPVADAVIDALNDPANLQDRWLPDALTAAAARHDLPFLAKALTAHARLENEPGAVAVAGTAQTGPSVALQLNDKTSTIIARVAEHFAKGGPVDELSKLINALVVSEAPAREVIIAGLAKGWPKDGKVELSENTEKLLLTLMEKLPAAARGNLATLAGRWGNVALEKYSSEVAAMLLGYIGDVRGVEDSRIASARQFIDMRKSDGAAVRELLKLITPRATPTLAAALLESLRQSEAPDAGATIVAALPGLTPSARNHALAALLSRSDWTPALLKGFEEGKALLSELSLDQKQALATHPDKAIAAAAKKLLASGGGLPNADRQKVIDELTAQVMGKGDVAAGKQVFNDNCAKCHMHGGVGGKVGPDLTGMAAHPKMELLIHIFDPSRSVEGNFRQYTVITTAGTVVVGLLAAETRTSLDLLDAEGKSHSLQRDEIKKIIASEKSLMPEGFERQVNPKAITDLLEFLTKPGKYVPLDLRKAATVITTKSMFVDENSNAERLIFEDWSPKTFQNVPFHLVDPQGDRTPNAIQLHSSSGKLASRMPKSAALECNVPVKALHLLSGVSGWGYNGSKTEPTVSMIVRLHYADKATEDHPLQNGVHFADYIRTIEVPQSKLAFKLRDQQLRYLVLYPKRQEVVTKIELIKGPDHTAPVVMAMTLECHE